MGTGHALRLLRGGEVQGDAAVAWWRVERDLDSPFWQEVIGAPPRARLAWFVHHWLVAMTGHPVEHDPAAMADLLAAYGPREWLITSFHDDATTYQHLARTSPDLSAATEPDNMAAAIRQAWPAR